MATVKRSDANPKISKSPDLGVIPPLKERLHTIASIYATQLPVIQRARSPPSGARSATHDLSKASHAVPRPAAAPRPKTTSDAADGRPAAKTSPKPQTATAAAKPAERVFHPVRAPAERNARTSPHRARSMSVDHGGPDVADSAASDSAALQLPKIAKRRRSMPNAPVVATAAASSPPPQPVVAAARAELSKPSSPSSRSSPLRVDSDLGSSPLAALPPLSSPSSRGPSAIVLPRPLSAPASGAAVDDAPETEATFTDASDEEPSEAAEPATRNDGPEASLDADAPEETTPADNAEQQKQQQLAASEEAAATIVAELAPEEAAAATGNSSTAGPEDVASRLDETSADAADSRGTLDGTQASASDSDAALSLDGDLDTTLGRADSPAASAQPDSVATPVSPRASVEASDVAATSEPTATGEADGEAPIAHFRKRPPVGADPPPDEDAAQSTASLASPASDPSSPASEQQPAPDAAEPATVDTAAAPEEPTVGVPTAADSASDVVAAGDGAAPSDPSDAPVAESSAPESGTPAALASPVSASSSAAAEESDEATHDGDAARPDVAAASDAADSDASAASDPDASGSSAAAEAGAADADDGHPELDQVPPTADAAARPPVDVSSAAPSPAAAEAVEAPAASADPDGRDIDSSSGHPPKLETAESSHQLVKVSHAVSEVDVDGAEVPPALGAADGSDGADGTPPVPMPTLTGFPGKQHVTQLDATEEEALTCHNCEQSVVGPYLLAMQHCWHIGHFSCTNCQQPLEGGGSYFEVQDRPYCHPCYLTLFTPKCAACLQPIVSDYVDAMDETWHAQCFVCAECDCSLADGFYDLDGVPFCHRHYCELKDQIDGICYRCHEPIHARKIIAMDQTWHHDHFVCYKCTKPFVEDRYYEHEQQPFCEGCYIDMFAPKCARCAQPIVGEVVSAIGQKWHAEHFTCAADGCNAAFDDGKFWEVGGQPYCAVHVRQQQRLAAAASNGLQPQALGREPSHLRLQAAAEKKPPRETCFHCKEPLSGKTMVAMGHKYHPNHFVCRKCELPFEGGRYFEHDDNPYCEKDYVDLFAPKCAGCLEPIRGDVTSAMGLKWHPACFVCADCKQPFVDNKFFNVGGRPMCPLHAGAEVQSEPAAEPNMQDRPETPQRQEVTLVQ